jgi:hypothetical protein
MKMETYNTDNIIDSYCDNGFKAIRCKGYNPTYNPDKDYKNAKTPVTKGFTAPNYKGLTLDEIKAWEKTGGWVGWVIPKGYIALDVEDRESIAVIDQLCKEKNLSPAVHLTKNGRHYIFKLSKDLSAASSVFTKCGIEVTYRIGGKNYLILAPTDGRSWQI